MRAKHDLATDEGKVAYLKEAAGVIAQLPDRAAREVYAMRAASQCGVSPEAVQDEVRQQRRRRAAAARRQTEREELRPLRMSQPQERGIQYKNPRSAAAEEGVSGELSPEEFSLFTSVIQKPESAANAPRALADYIAIMRAADKAEGDLLAFQDRMKKTKSYGG